MLSISFKVALAVGISLSVAAISSIFVTMVASQNLTSSSGSIGGSQSNNQVQQSSEQQNTATSSSERENNTSIISTITIPEGATAQNVQHYQPGPARVAPSSHVTWNNKDSAPHTATALDGSFDTGTIQPGESGSATVPAQGTIPYHCTIHPWMTSTLQVSSSSFSSSSAVGSSSSSSSSLQQNETGAQQPQQQEGETQTAQSGNNISSFNQTITTASNAAEGLQQSNSTGSK